MWHWDEYQEFVWEVQQSLRKLWKCGDLQIFIILHTYKINSRLITFTFLHFDEGVDLSEAMVQEANQCFQHQANVAFKVAKAEAIPVESSSTQLVLVGRAIHYFDQKTFFEEVDRILVSYKRHQSDERL